MPYPYLSLEERDRRWALVRGALESNDLDALVVPSAARRPWQLAADARYLTHVGGWDEPEVAVVFPLEGEPTAIVADPEAWRQAQPWCADLRGVREGFGPSVAARLTELRLPRRRVGILESGTPEATEGAVEHGFLQAVANRFPYVRWVDFTSQMGEIRAVKSAEEIAFLEQSVRIVNEAHGVAARSARPGTTERATWAAAIETLHCRGSEMSVDCRWAAGPHPGQRGSFATDRVVEPSWLFLAELEAAWGGYRARADQPFSSGAPEARYSDLMQLAADIWNETAAEIRPGVPIHGLVKHAERLAAVHRPRTGWLAAARASATIRGCGLGGDGPIISTRPGRNEPPRLTVTGQGWCFLLRIRVAVEETWLSWGDSIVVTNGGTRRLGRGPQRILGPS